MKKSKFLSIILSVLFSISFLNACGRSGGGGTDMTARFSDYLYGLIETENFTLMLTAKTENNDVPLIGFSGDGSGISMLEPYAEGGTPTIYYILSGDGENVTEYRFNSQKNAYMILPVAPNTLDAVYPGMSIMFDGFIQAAEETTDWYAFYGTDGSLTAGFIYDGKEVTLNITDVGSTVVSAPENTYDPFEETEELILDTPAEFSSAEMFMFTAAQNRIYEIVLDVISFVDSSGSCGFTLKSFNKNRETIFSDSGKYNLDAGGTVYIFLQAFGYVDGNYSVSISEAGMDTDSF